MAEDYRLGRARRAEWEARRSGDREEERRCTSLVNQLVAESIARRRQEAGSA